MNINDILNKPLEELEALPTEQLKALLEPFIPATRTPVLPPEKPGKMGVPGRMVKEALDKNKELIEQLRMTMRGKK